MFRESRNLSRGFLAFSIFDYAFELKAAAFAACHNGYYTGTWNSKLANCCKKGLIHYFTLECVFKNVFYKQIHYDLLYVLKIMTVILNYKITYLWNYNFSKNLSFFSWRLELYILDIKFLPYTNLQLTTHQEIQISSRNVVLMNFRARAYLR